MVNDGAVEAAFWATAIILLTAEVQDVSVLRIRNENGLEATLAAETVNVDAVLPLDHK